MIRTEKLSKGYRQGLSRTFVLRNINLEIDDLTVYENLETPLLYKGLKKKERQSKVAEMLDRFSVVAKKDLFPRQLSGGQQQMVAIARALIIDPKVILADEPTGNLQSKQSKMIMDWLLELNEEEGVTIVQVTHNERWTRYGDRVIELEDGRVVADRPAATVEV